MKILRRSLAGLLIITMVFTLLISMPVVKVIAAPVVATDTTVVCNDAPAGMKTTVTDTGDGFISLTLSFQGTMNFSFFSWAVKYDKTRVIPGNQYVLGCHSKKS